MHVCLFVCAYLSVCVFVCVCVMPPDVGYHIAVKTGSIPGSSSDSKVFVKLYGEKGDTSRMMLEVSDNNLGNYFETARIDIFTVETFDIGQVRLHNAFLCALQDGRGGAWSTMTLAGSRRYANTFIKEPSRQKVLGWRIVGSHVGIFEQDATLSRTCI